MRRITKAFFGVPKFLLLATLVSLVIFFCNELWLKNLPAWFEGASKIGDLVSQICLSVITGYLFYAIVNQFKENKDRENLTEIIAQTVTEI